MLLIWIYVGAVAHAAGRPREQGADAGSSRRRLSCRRERTSARVRPELVMGPVPAGGRRVLRPHRRHRLAGDGARAGLLPGASAGPHPGLAERARAAYPKSEVPYEKITASYLAGAGLNSFIPARVGDAVKIFLAKRSIRGSSYPAITSSFFVQSVFDTRRGSWSSSSRSPRACCRRRPSCPTCPPSRSPSGRRTRTFRSFSSPPLDRRDRLRDARPPGRGVLGEGQAGACAHRHPRYLRRSRSWQGLGWAIRFCSFWFFLEAFHIGGSFQNVMLVMSVQAIATLLPFTPGGAGAQQALLVATLTGPGADRGPRPTRSASRSRSPPGPRSWASSRSPSSSAPPTGAA